MLQIKHLTKVYKTKGGTETKALDDVSIEFGDKGLVFLLGKSGSGKSTLLNLAGGLDEPTSGEVVVMGKSSKDFSGSDFDSYRNTFVGFIFQEYNILNEFTVEDNIALALELQGKKKDKEKIYSILKDVELEQFAKRKPNTLSGGQKQRIAIARALIKDPQIIMADEPTGALDSATGKQVFDTLKHLSETRLVLVVSHDREFAEIYGDRIVELKDGQIISDVTKVKDAPVEQTAALVEHGPDIITIRHGAPLDSATLHAVEAFIRASDGDVILTKGEKNVESFRRANRIDESGATERFTETPPQDVPEQDGKKVKFIRSRLPMGKAIKMGVSGLKTKPVRLIFTILLAVVAFVMFGVLSTFMLYDPAFSVSQALQEAAYPSLTVAKNYKYQDQYVRIYRDGHTETEEPGDYEYTNPAKFGVQELKEKNAQGNGNYAGVAALQSVYGYGFTANINLSLVVDSHTEQPGPKESGYYLVKSVSGFSDCGEAYMQANGFHIIDDLGHYPTNKTEIALPNYLAELFVQTENLGLTKVTDLVGKKITFSNSPMDQSEQFTITAIYDVGAIPSKFDELKTGTGGSGSHDQNDETAALRIGLQDVLTASFHTVIYVSEDFLDTYKYDNSNSYSNGPNIRTEYYRGIDLQLYPFDGSQQPADQNYGYSFLTDQTKTMYDKFLTFYGLDGTKKEYSLNDTQVYLSESCYRGWLIDGYRDDFNTLLYNVGTEFVLLLDEDFSDRYGNTDLYGIFNEMSRDENAFQRGVDFVETWFPVLRGKMYQYRVANLLASKIKGDTAAQTTYADFLSTVKQIENHLTPNEESVRTAVPDALWTQLNTQLTQIKGDTKFAYLFNVYEGQLVQELADYNGSRMRAVLDGESGDYGTFANLVGAAEQNDATALAKLNSLLDKYYASIVLCGRGMEGGFEYVPSSIDWKLYYNDFRGDKGELEVVGYFTLPNENYGADYFMNTSFLSAHAQKENNGDDWEYDGYSVQLTDYVPPEDARYDFIVTLTNNTQEEISVALATDNPSVELSILNSVYSELSMFLDLITEMQLIFLIIGLVVGVFAALMLLNFISVSISAKKKEIGILRAVGARGSDTFKIFFSEGLVISLICFVLASVASFFVCGILNSTLADIVSIELLNFGILNIALIFAISLGVSLIATFLPVFFAARKKPVESIRAL